MLFSVLAKLIPNAKEIMAELPKIRNDVPTPISFAIHPPMAGLNADPAPCIVITAP